MKSNDEYILCKLNKPLGWHQNMDGSPRLFLHQRNHQVSFICRKGDAIEDYCQKNSIPVKCMHFGADYNPIAVQRFIQLMKSEKTDLVVTNISKDIRTAGMAARILGITHVNRLGLASDLKNSFRQRCEYQH